MKTLIDELSYNRWANLRLIETSVELDTKRFMQRVESSFPSVQKTWIHIIWAEELWYERWNSRSFITEYSSDDFPTVESIRNKIEVLSANQLQYIK
ncbi:MAG: DinB family protein, partial [Candidatus Thorarchaeota archaeon]